MAVLDNFAWMTAEFDTASGVEHDSESVGAAAICFYVSGLRPINRVSIRGCHGYTPRSRKFND
jgi:hypothetical protein